VAADRTIQGTEMNLVLVFIQAVKQEYVGWVGVDLLSSLVSALLEVNDQLHAPTDFMPLSKPSSALTTGKGNGHGYEENEPPSVKGVFVACMLLCLVPLSGGSGN
jgi:hypothetical protein